MIFGEGEEEEVVLLIAVWLWFGAGTLYESLILWDSMMYGDAEQSQKIRGGNQARRIPWREKEENETTR